MYVELVGRACYHQQHVIQCARAECARAEYAAREQRTIVDCGSQHSHLGPDNVQDNVQDSIVFLLEALDLVESPIHDLGHGQYRGAYDHRILGKVRRGVCCHGVQGDARHL